MAVRGAFVWLHRWVGLAMAGFLILVGLTGSLLAFNTELERVFAPQLFAKTHRDQSRLDLATLALRAQALVPPHARIFSVTYTEADQVFVTVEPRVDPQTQAPYALDFDELYLDPGTGDKLGRRLRGNLSQGLINLMPFIYNLHWRLALGDTGQWILAITALAWTIDCFVAFYLTLPPTAVDFLRRWKTSWLIKRGAGFYRLNFDLHRAGGLWLWAMLFIFAWSSVMMNLRPVFDPIMGAMFDYRTYTPPPAHRVDKPELDWAAALRAGERLIVEQAAQSQFRAGEAQSLMYDAESNTYSYMVHGSRDLFERAPKGGGTSVTFDGDTGALVELSQPTGERLGNTIESWLYTLHMARIFGLPYRIFVCALGLIIVMLSVTGVYIWWKKWRARRIHADRDRALRALADR